MAKWPILDRLTGFAAFKKTFSEAFPVKIF
jgi:hypothetical protein